MGEGLHCWGPTVRRGRRFTLRRSRPSRNRRSRPNPVRLVWDAANERPATIGSSSPERRDVSSACTLTGDYLAERTHYTAHSLGRMLVLARIIAPPRAVIHHPLHNQPTCLRSAPKAMAHRCLSSASSLAARHYALDASRAHIRRVRKPD